MRLPRNYDEMTPQQRRLVREEYVSQQDNRCHFCGVSLDEEPVDDVLNRWVNERLFPEGFFRWPVHLHHNRDSGMTIGAVHARCNAVLWQYYGE